MLQPISNTSLALLLCINTIIGIQQNQQKDLQSAIDAISKGNIEALENVLKEHPELVSVKDTRYGATLLHWAAAQKNLRAIDVLIKHNASRAEKNNEQATPLMLAIVPTPGSPTLNAEDLLYVVRTLATPEIANMRNIEGKTALHLASQYGQTEVVRSLIKEHKADVHARTNNRKQPLDYAKNPEISKMLKDEMAVANQPPEPPDAYNTPLHTAAGAGNLEEVKTLLLTNRKWLNQQNRNWETPLHLAAKNSRLEVVAHLIKEGAEVSLEDNQGRNFLQLQCGASPNNAPVNR